MMVLDTNVLSELMRQQPDANGLKRIDAEPDIAITAITVGEIQYGSTRLPNGKRKSELQSTFQAPLPGQVLHFYTLSTVDAPR